MEINHPMKSPTMISQHKFLKFQTQYKARWVIKWKRDYIITLKNIQANEPLHLQFIIQVWLEQNVALLQGTSQQLHIAFSYPQLLMQQELYPGWNIKENSSLTFASRHAIYEVYLRKGRNKNIQEASLDNSLRCPKLASFSSPVLSYAQPFPSARHD